MNICTGIVRAERGGSKTNRGRGFKNQSVSTSDRERFFLSREDNIK